MNIIFSESSGKNDPVFGKCQAPIRMFLEQRGEAFEKKSMLSEFFCMDKTDNYADLLTSMTAMNGFDPVGENGEYPADSMEAGYEKLLAAVTWKDSFAISQEMVEDARLMDMRKRPAAFMNAYYRTRETFGAAIFGGAIAGQKQVKYRNKYFDIACADGEPVFSIKHKPKVSGYMQSNLFSNPFSVDALDRAEAAMQQFRGDNNEVLGIAPVTIAIANQPSLKRKVFAAVGADLDPDTANNGFNFQFGRWHIKIWNYLNQFIAAGAEPWMLLDEDYNAEAGGAVWHDRIPLTVKSTINDDNDANVWKGRARFNATFNDFRFACLGGIKGGTDLSTLKI